MFMYGDDYIVSLREKTSEIRKFLTISMLVITVLSFLHILYYGALWVDETTFLHYAGTSLSFFVTAFGLDYMDITSYMVASRYLMALNLPFVTIYALTTYFEELCIENHEKNVEKNRIKEIKKAQIKQDENYEKINKYSICLSLDFDKEMNDDTKKKIISKIYSKIEYYLKNYIINGEKKVGLELFHSKALVIMSTNFQEYDYVYAYVLKILSYISKKLSQKHNLNIIPSITTDAYSKPVSKYLAEKQHFEIKNSHFRNRACSTAEFSKKYKFLKKTKFAGTPVGLYATNNDFSDDTFELNIVYKNLSKILNA